MSGWTPYIVAIWKAGVDVGMPTVIGLSSGFPALDEAPEDRHVPARQGVVEDGARQPVDLDDQQAPPIAHGRGAQPETPHQPVDRRLGPEKEIVRSHALAGAPPQRSLGAGGASSREGGGAGTRAGAAGR